MATIKSFTSLEQSKKLAKILPIESADMYLDYDVQKHEYYPMVIDEQFDDTCVRAWSLSALLGVLPNASILLKGFDKIYDLTNSSGEIAREDNPVDACYEMIIKLHELNLL